MSDVTVPARTAGEAGSGDPVEPAVLDRAVQVGAFRYPVLVRVGTAASGALTEHVRGLAADRRCALVAGPGVSARQLGEVTAALEPLAPGGPAGGVLVAVGGRATLRRALATAGTAPVVLVPTTLGAMCGASVLVRGDAATGRPRAPALVWCRPDLLDGPQHGGLFPVLRDVLAICPYFYDSVAARLRPDGRYDPATLAAFVALCVEAQSGVLGYDPLGRGPGAVLRYGAGRAAGLLLAARVARRLGLLGEADADAHRRLVAAAGLSTAEQVWPDRAGTLVLLEALGRPHVCAGSLLTPVGPFGSGPGTGTGPAHDTAPVPLGHQDADRGRHETAAAAR
ncbi:dehydroquinate synthase/iron-containing alcohol dehydrogenase family protein [Streptacidiphilus rugosus]|uniref:hypothetical protein n=1 Tax=Streptacidiphilus rugosus TaxID=405783 RepID=UPI00056C06CF|nr:hypothetical protein [Streptacidiphilus rugosus]